MGKNDYSGNKKLKNINRSFYKFNKNIDETWSRSSNVRLKIILTLGKWALATDFSVFCIKD